jgi:NADH-quinone oxidoreductase subunit C
MDSTALVAKLQEAVPGARLESAASVDPQLTIYVKSQDLPEIARTLRDHPELRCVFLAELTAVDYWPREPRFEVVYIFVSIEHRLRVRLKVPLAGADPHVPTISGLWPAANWLEREVWDLFGIAFDDHPDPRRLLMPEDWEGYPLRKDSPLQIRMPARSTSPLQVTEEEFRANLERDRLTRSER